MNKKKKIKTSTVVLIFTFLVLTVFTIAMCITFNRIGSCPDTLIVSVFGACLGEFSILGIIRTTKQKYPNGADIEISDDFTEEV